jgi:UPF0271 protein
MDLSRDKLRNTLHEQISFVQSIAEEEGGRLSHVKPHGALYHDVIAKAELADCLAKVVCSIDPGLPIFGIAGSDLADIYGEHGIHFVHEAFADRRYASRTQLRSRLERDALIEDESVFRDHIRLLLRGKVADVDGQIHELPIDSICIHSDTPNAVAFARIARETIDD